MTLLLVTTVKMALVAASVLRAVCWVNPLVWLACRRLREESEYACDDVVLGRGVNGSDNATHLLEIARTACRSRHTWMAVPAIAHPSALEHRIRAMLLHDRNRMPLTPLARLVTSLTLGAATAIVAAAAVSAAPSPVLELGPDRELIAEPPQPMPTSRIAPATPVAMAPAQAAPAQPGSAMFSGRLWDQLGGVLPGVRVTLTSVTGGAGRLAVSDGSGVFQFTAVPEGSYRLTAQLAGFRPLLLEVPIARGAVLERGLTLQIGSLQETISVVGTRGAVTSIAAPPPPRPPPPPPDAARPEVPFNGTFAVPPGPVKVGGVIRAPTKVRHVNPIYPASMQVAGTEGLVLLRATIDADGYVREAAQAGNVDGVNTPHPDLVAAAIDAVKGWQFTPTRLDNVPVEVEMSVSVQFSLR